MEFLQLLNPDQSTEHFLLNCLLQGTFILAFFLALFYFISSRHSLLRHHLLLCALVSILMVPFFNLSTRPVNFSIPASETSPLVKEEISALAKAKVNGINLKGENKKKHVEKINFNETTE